MTILDKIIKEKKNEVAKLKKEMQRSPEQQEDLPAVRGSFRSRVEAQETMSIIAEIKRASPSKGVINADVDPIKQAETYATYGASAISVLTDTPFFQGTMDDLRAVRKVVDVPVLCKDFIIDPVQIDRAVAAGANIILLIAAALEDDQLKSLYDYAQKSGVEILCEVHNEEEMDRVIALGADIIGINNRNLKTFEVDLETTTRLANKITDPNTILVSESGIETVADVEFVAAAGARAILVGETFMRTDNLKGTIQSFQVPLP